MLYRLPSHETPPTSSESNPIMAGYPTAEIDLAVVGYAYACIGSALSLINKGENIDDGFSEGRGTILSEWNGYTFWSASDTAKNNISKDKAITFAFQMEESSCSGIQSLSKLWIAEPRIDKKSACLMIVRDNDGTPSAYRYTGRKGWHSPGKRQIKKVFQYRLLPLDKSESIRPRRELFKMHDYEYFAKTMQEFEQYQQEK